MGMTAISDKPGGLKPARKLRVVHVVKRSFGWQFDGHTHYVFSLLSGWRDDDIVLGLWGSSVRPTNVGSGTRDYQLASQLWSSVAGRRSRRMVLLDAARQLWFLLTHARTYDIAHFHHLGLGTLLSPPLLHLLGKKAVFNSTLYDSDNPSAVLRSKRGRLAFHLLSRFDAILTISPLLAEDYRTHGFRNVACIPHFVAIPQLQHGRDDAGRHALRQELSIPSDATVLLFIGAIIRRKGVDLLAESFARLAQRQHDLWLIAVGPSGKKEAASHEEVFVQDLKERIDGAHASSRVVWTGTVRDKNVLARYYSAADIFVLPTRAEGLANVLIEASSAGIPVVATDLPGITDVPVADGETGFLTPLEDVDALTQAIERLVTDPSMRAKMGKAARERSKRFGFEDYHRDLKAFYLKVAGLSR